MKSSSGVVHGAANVSTGSESALAMVNVVGACALMLRWSMVGTLAVCTKKCSVVPSESPHMSNDTVMVMEFDNVAFVGSVVLVVARENAESVVGGGVEDIWKISRLYLYP